MDLFFFFCVLCVIGITVFYSVLYGITPTPTSAKVKSHIFKMLPIMDRGQIVELGSGWGMLAISLARHFPHCKVIGYEISPFPYIISKMLSYYFDYPNLIFKRENFFNVSFENVSLAVCYLYPGAMEHLKEKFEKELPKNAYVISHTFAIPGWKPLCREYVDDLYGTPIYLYQV